MNLSIEQLEALYTEIAQGDREAFEFIRLWSLYCHRFDDLVDVKFDLELLIKTNNELTRLMSCNFFCRHKEFLIGQIYLAAESYEASEEMKLSGKYEERLMGDYLSHEGNNMLRTVALLVGGYDLCKRVSPKIRKLTYLEHPLVEKNI